MKKQQEYKVYYQDEEITTVTKSSIDGDYVVIDKDTFLKVSVTPSAYKVVDNKLIEKQIENTNGKKKKKLTVKGHDTFPGWVIVKYQLYEPIEYAIEEPEWFDSETHSVVGYEDD